MPEKKKKKKKRVRDTWYDKGDTFFAIYILFFSFLFLWCVLTLRSSGFHKKKKKSAALFFEKVPTDIEDMVDSLSAGCCIFFLLFFSKSILSEKKSCSPLP